ncbi:hypothetical protein BKA70DRAFT_1215914 [Coprinopsis sp. MPI-PUGE-AT-0042]|nr:hypothetical protein BKA70DRAFT_1215914 [Coprinopsis sp. MPI-PUGE-AT-0042]
MNTRVKTSVKTRQVAKRSQGAPAPRKLLAVKVKVLGTGPCVPPCHPTWQQFHCHMAGAHRSSSGLCIVMADPNRTFVCLCCWGRELPYPHRVIGGHAVRTSVPCLNLSKMAVILFMLVGSKDFGDPTKAAFDVLKDYLQGNTMFIKVVFNFALKAAVKRSGDWLVKVLESQEHQEYVSTPLYCVEAENLSSIDQFLVLLSSHSNPEHRDVHM